MIPSDQAEAERRYPDAVNDGQLLTAKMSVIMEDLRAAYIAGREDLRAAKPIEWRCFHCDEAFTDKQAAADHFGLELAFDEAACVEKLQQGDKAIIEDRRMWRDRALQAEAENDAMGHRLHLIEYDIRHRFKGCKDLSDVFHAYDSMEGRALAAEERAALAAAGPAAGVGTIEAAARVVETFKSRGVDRSELAAQIRALAASPPPAADGDLPQFWKLCQCGNELQPIRAPLEEHEPHCRYRLAVEAVPAAAGVGRELVIEAARRLSAAFDAVEIALATPTLAVGHAAHCRARLFVLKTEIQKLRALASEAGLEKK